ncbi:hypothetical protein MBLNU230_g2002t1 [Neophaeotheca triangularis]
MVFANNGPQSSKIHDGDLDSEGIASGQNTPPHGAAPTPRPDPTDKRLPALNSYFAQVKQSLRFPTSRSSQAPPAPAPEPTHSTEEKPTRSSMSASRTPSDTYESPPLLSHEQPQTHASSHYPTPPLSTSSSMLGLNAEVGVDRACDALPSRQRSLTTRRSVAAPPHLRRHTLSNTLSNVVTKRDVSAHLSNPAASSDVSAKSSVAHASASDIQSQKRAELTPSAARTQTTPPQTPRSASQESRKRDASRDPVKSSRSSSGNSNPGTIGQIKGQLEINVEEARGLRPSYQPYVVCIFQLNEDISEGPKEDDMDTSAVDSSEPSEDLSRGIAMKRMGSGSGAPVPIPGMGRRQTSQTNIAEMRRGSKAPEHHETTEPKWSHKAVFDVVGVQNEVDISVYDRSNNEAFLGHVRLQPRMEEFEHQHEDWYKLEPREGEKSLVTGEIRLRIAFHNSGRRQFGPDDFEILKLIGKGTFGQVFQVRKKDNKRVYAMKVLSKKVIVQKKEIQHTIGERNILVRTATTESPFIVGLKFSFQTAADLYLVTDYMSGGELFWHLQKEGRFNEERAKFYIAELILSLRHLHEHDIVYRDLKPENILLDANGHVALCDFGLSKANLSKNDTTNTFCGTTEYLAPEVLLDEQGYTKMVDFWSLGVLVFEMCCGWSPFYAEDTQQMYKNIAFGKVRFPRDALSTEGRNFVKGLLNRNPAHRLGAKGDAQELMEHPFFADVNWTKLASKSITPPFKPKLKGELDTSNFDPEFTNALESGNASSLNARAAALASGVGTDNTPLSPTMQNQFKGFTFVDESTLEQQYADRQSSITSQDGNLSKSYGSRNGDRMSGVERTDADFNHGQLDDI